MMGPMSPYVAGVLGLSAEQQAQIEAMQRDKAREHWQLMQEMHTQAQAMMQLRRQADPDPEALVEAHRNLSETQREMLRFHAESMRAMREILTAEQRHRLDEMRGFSEPQQ